jgi:hypothetical protein
MYRAVADRQVVAREEPVSPRATPVRPPRAPVVRIRHGDPSLEVRDEHR